MEILFTKLIDSKRVWYLFGFIIFLGILGGSLFYLSRVRYARQHHFYSLEMPTLPTGIMMGSPINLFGIKVGKVEEIGVDDTYDKVEMRFSVLNEVKNNLKKDASLVIIPQPLVANLIGPVELNLHPGNDLEPLGNGTMRLVVEESIDRLLNKTLRSVYDDIVPDAILMTKYFSKLGERLDRVDFDRIELVVKGFEENLLETGKFIITMQTELKTIIEEISKFTGSMFGEENDIANSINRIVDETESLVQSANKISNRVPVLLESLDKTVDEFSTIGMALQKHWLIRGYVKDVKGEADGVESNTKKPRKMKN